MAISNNPPLNAGFDWRWSGMTYLAVDFSAPGAYHGAHCLRVDFTVNRNNEYEPVYQIVPVLPNQTYGSRLTSARKTSLLTLVLACA